MRRQDTITAAIRSIHSNAFCVEAYATGLRMIAINS